MTHGPRPTFIGRQQSLMDLCAFLETAGLTSVVGAAGIGKSRLVEEFKAQWSGDCLRVDLAHETDERGCASTLGRALRLPDTASADVIGQTLASHNMLLLWLDNADPVVAPVAQLLTAWMIAAPALRIVVTSRQRLRLHSERILELGPLRLEGGVQSEASQLLIDRVARSAPSATLSEAQVLQLSTWLEGIPLAIELAAACVPLLGDTTGQRRIDLLQGGFRDGPERHTTLSSAIAWSWTRLTPKEQTALARASAFSGTFDASLGQKILHADTAEAMSLLRSFTDKSLIQIGSDGRLSLLSAVREYAAEADKTAHVESLSRLDHLLASSEHSVWASAHLDDILAAAARVVDGTTTCKPQESGRILHLAARVLAADGLAEQLHTLMQRGLERLPDLHADLRTQLRIQQAASLRILGRLEEAQAVTDAALEDADALLAEVKTELYIEAALARHAQRNLEGAAELYTRTLAFVPSRRAEGRLHANLGAVAHDRGELQEAEASYRRALIALGVTGDRRLLGVTRSNLALLYQERGDLNLAKDAFERALDDLNTAGEHYLGAIHRSNLGQLLVERNELEDAHLCLDEALEVLKRSGDPRSMVLCLCKRAACTALEGDYSNALSDLEDGWSRAHGIADPLLNSVLRLHDAFVPLGRALTHKNGENGENGETRSRRIHECRAILSEVDQAEAGANWRLSDDARCARRILQTRLGALLTSPSALPDDALIVGIESRFFRIPGGGWQDLRRQTAARRILEHLVERQGQGGATLADLQAAAWPGEHIRKDAATNRIHVALSKLRQRGLRELLERDADGYQLSDHVIVHRLPQVLPPK